MSDSAESSSESDIELSELMPHTEEESTEFSRTLAIGIFTHGGIKIHEHGPTVGYPLRNTNFPIGVRIKKQNVASYGSISVGKYATDATYPHEFYEKTRDAINSVESCIDSVKYLRRMANYNHDNGSYNPLHNPEGACRLFDGYDNTMKRNSRSTTPINILFLCWGVPHM